MFNLTGRKLALLGVTLVAAIVLVALLSFNSDLFKPKASTESDKETVKNYNGVLVAQLNQYKAHPSSELLSSIKSNLGARSNKMNGLASGSPKDFLLLTMPENLRSQFPTELQPLIEEKITVSGEMNVKEWDNFEKGTSGRINKIKTASGNTYELYFVDPDSRLKNGDKVKVTGIKESDYLVTYPTMTGDLGTEVVAEGVPLAAPSMHKGAVILFNFSNDPTNQPFILDNLKNTVYYSTTSTDKMWQEASYGGIGLYGDGFGPYTIAAPSTTCDPDTWQAQANAAAGINYYSYNHVMYVFPKTVCGWSGLGDAPGGSTWYNGGFTLHVTTHELGHNLGLWHGRGYKCVDTAGGFVSMSSSCTSVTYQDNGDTMGNGTVHYQAYYKRALNWIPSANVKTVTASGTYAVVAQEQAASGTQVLMIPSGIAGKSYYIEARNNFGFDKSFYNSPFVLGVPLRLVNSYVSGADTDLVDMTPDGAFPNAPLLVGQTFTDPWTGTAITLVSKDQAQAVVTVDLSSTTCIKVNPTTTISPLVGPAVAAGTPVSYTVTVKNENSTACAPMAFGLYRTSTPSKWTYSFSPTSINLASGATGTATFTLTSTGSAQDGSYDFTVTSGIADDQQYFSRVTATYWIGTSTGFTGSADKTSATSGDTVTYTLSYSNTTGGTLQNVRIEDNIPLGTTFVEGSATAGATFDGSKVILNLGDLTTGASAYLSFKVTVN